MKRIKIGMLAVLLAAALAGCGKGETSENAEVMESGGTQLATDDKAGTEELASNEVPKETPAMVSGVMAMVMSAVLDKLEQYEFDIN